MTLDEQGLYMELGAYQYHVFLDFRQVEDNEWGQYAQLAAYLDGRGVPSIDETLKEIVLQPVHYPFRALTNAGMTKRLLTAQMGVQHRGVDDGLLNEVEQKAAHLLAEINNLTGAGRDEDDLKSYAHDIRRKVQAIIELPMLSDIAANSTRRNFKSAVKLIVNDQNTEDEILRSLSISLGWAFTHKLGRVMGEEGAVERSRSWVDEWLLGRILATSLEDLGLDESDSLNAVAIIKILISHQNWYEIKTTKSKRAYQILKSILEDEDVQRFLQVNRYQDILWFNKEAYEQLLSWLLKVGAINTLADVDIDETQSVEQIANQYRIIRKLKKAESGSNYQLEKLIEATRK
jgi:hypothetical protein